MEGQRRSLHWFDLQTWGAHYETSESDFKFSTESFPILQVIPYSEHFDVGEGESSD